MNPIISGCDASWNRLDNAGTCGFGDNLPSLDDLVSRKLMGETKGASENLIVFIPQPIQEQNNFQKKVFAATELEQIFQNDTFQTINGIPKEQLKSIYDEKNNGKEYVYNIISETSQQVVGDEQSLEGQAELLTHAISENGSLTPESNMYTIHKCYDENDTFVGVELISKNQEQPLIVAPESTVRKEGIQSDIQQSGKEIDILQPNVKLSLFQDIDGTIRIGSKPKLTLKQGLNGELILGTDAAKESAKQFGKMLDIEKVR